MRRWRRWRRSASGRTYPRRQARAARRAPRIDPRMESGGARHERRRAAARSRVRAARRSLRSRDQHGRAHGGAARFLAALPDAVSTEFGNAAREQGIDEELLYGIARQESRFAADIVSSAGAVGLMQLMPGTARWVAKQLDRRRLLAVAHRQCRPQHAVRRVLFQILAGPPRSAAGACRRRLQCRTGPRAVVAAGDRIARRRDLGRDDSVQRDARLREAGAGQHDGLRACARPTVRRR